jgi:hypothetical protein
MPHDPVLLTPTLRFSLAGVFFNDRSNIQTRQFNGKTVAYASACFEYAQ